MKNKFVGREKFCNLLMAVHNIGEGVEPGDQKGVNATDGGMDAVDAIYTLLEKRKPGYSDGVISVIRLLAEVSCASDPIKYVNQEIDKGFGDAEPHRHEDENAGISLPWNVKV